ncbi:hypothetical protein HDA32_001119 [Spinactinospora alkalitolerans]|uniref:Uncharacterized protein n=1 Tax=Spinactinospora alkalitolerans TaxID=687207 RepID=A0A852TPT5_9ACTN|nr:hypothetical protein [Spinactinospora alkalitolerans]NYE45999.1 hypothetical protein [Spinactinospora alkalitolerans]
MSEPQYPWDEHRGPGAEPPADGPGYGGGEPEGRVPEAPVRNSYTNQGDAENIIQAGTVYGGVHSHHRYEDNRQTIGQQHNYFAVDLFEAGHFKSDYVEFVRETFVSAVPERHRRFVSDLKATGSGAVVGEPGTGRRWAAIAALAELGLPIRPVQVEEDEAWSAAKLVCDSGQGYLIDLSGTGPLTETRAQSLHSYAAKARERGSAVVIVMRDGQSPDGGIGGARRLPVTAPRGRDVFLRHLHHLLPAADADAWLKDERVTAALDEARPASAARMARLAHEAFLADPQVGQDDWITLALSAYGNWEEELKKWFERRQSEAGIYDRVLLATVAMLEHEPADQVLIAAARLAGELEVAPSDATGISGAGLEATVRRVGAEVGPDRTVRFTDLAYSPAVLDYLWWQHPRVRKPLLDWSTRIPDGGHPPTWPARIAERWLGLAERHDDFAWVTGLFIAWARSARTVDVAVAMAGNVAARPREGRAMRRTLYEIAKNPSDRALAIAAVRVCSTYGTLDPGTALTRLKWLADLPDDKVRHEVHRTLSHFAASPEIRPQVLRELTEWANDPRRRGRHQVAREAIAALLATVDDTGLPVLLADAMAAEQRPLNRAIARAWHPLLETEYQPLAGPPITAWLNSLVKERGDFAVIADILSGAAEDSIPRVAAASKLIDHWHAEQDSGGTPMILELKNRVHDAVSLAPKTGEARREGL